METVFKTTLDGVFRIERPTHEDNRGFFRESMRLNDLEKATGQHFRIVQSNHARSKKNTLRGIHTAPWNKLIYVTRGRVQTVVVDLRINSRNFGKYESFILGDENKSSIFIPVGIGNSYLVLSDDADYTYLTDEEWSPGKENSVLWNDPDLNIKWDTKNPNLSEKDKQNPTLRSLFPEKF